MKISIDSSLIIPIIITLMVIIFGTSFFLSNWAYSENGSLELFLSYLVISIILFFTLRNKKHRSSIFIFLIIIFIIAYSNIKFDWRKNYIQDTNDGVYFLLDPYISSYPTLEKHLFSWVSGTPKWIDFTDDCFKPALKNKEIPRKCRSESLIQENYNINITTMVNDYYAKMKSTAKKIERGRIKNKKQLEACLNNKKCAMIPLLPAGVDEITESSTKYKKTRKMFWSIINDKEISPEVCDYISLCKAMRNTGVIAIKQLETN